MKKWSVLSSYSWIPIKKTTWNNVGNFVIKKVDLKGDRTLQISLQGTCELNVNLKGGV